MPPAAPQQNILLYTQLDFGNKLAGYLSGFYVPQSGTLVKLYAGIAVGLLISAGLLALLTPRVKKLMGTVN